MRCGMRGGIRFRFLHTCHTRLPYAGASDAWQYKVTTETAFLGILMYS
jgi:hypothetical protein